MTSQRILITGATGFIGRRLCEVLSRQGCELVALSRNPDSARRQLPLLKGAFQWGQSVPQAALQNVSAVIHLAGESVVGRWTKRKKHAIYQSRIQGTRTLVQALGRSGQPPATLISASAIGFYGDRGEETLDEDSPPGQGFTAEVAQAWEREALAAQRLGLRVACLRIGVVLDLGGGALQAMLLPFRLGLGGPLGHGRQWWSWIHRDDLVEIFRWVLEKTELAGVFNATAPAPVRQKEFARWLGSVLRRPSFIPTPALAMKLLLSGFAGELLSSKKVIPSRLVETGFQFRFPQLPEALREIFKL